MSGTEQVLNKYFFGVNKHRSVLTAFEVPFRFLKLLCVSGGSLFPCVILIAVEINFLFLREKDIEYVLQRPYVIVHC